MQITWAAEELETIPCDLCESVSTHVVIRRPDQMTVVKCDECGLCFLNPRPKAVERFYDQAYFEKPDEADRHGYSNYFSDESRLEMTRLARTRLDAILKVIGKLPARCLEVGCSTGEFCGTLKRSGSHPVGLDLSEAAIAVARSRYPEIQFLSGDIEKLSESELFDAVFGFELIEHVLSPKRFFRAASRLLNKGGILAMTTPNVNCMEVTGTDKWAGFLWSFEHLYFLSPETLNRYASLEGFEMVGWLTGGGNGLVPPPRPPVSSVRSQVKKVADKVGLLGLARSIKPKRSKTGEASTFDWESSPFEMGGHSHNLLVVLRKL